MQLQILKVPEKLLLQICIQRLKSMESDVCGQQQQAFHCLKKDELCTTELLLFLSVQVYNLLDDATQIQGMILIHIPIFSGIPSQAQAEISFASFPGIPLSSQGDNQN